MALQTSPRVVARVAEPKNHRVLAVTTTATVLSAFGALIHLYMVCTKR
jgi:hypothetical protein